MVSREPLLSQPVIQDIFVDEDRGIETLNEDPMHIMINDAFGLSRLCANEESFPSSPEHSGGVKEVY